MLERTIHAGHRLVGRSLHFEESTNVVWGVTRNGEVRSVRLLDGAGRVWGAGYRRPVAVLPSSDGLTLHVVERRGRVWFAARSDANQADAILVADLPGHVLAARHHPDGDKLVMLVDTAISEPQLMVIEVGAQGEPSEPVVLGQPVAGVSAIAVDTVRRCVFVASSAPGGDVGVLAIDVDTGAEIAGTTASVPTVAAMVVDPDPATFGVVALDSLGQLHAIEMDGTVGAPVALAGGRGLTRWGSLLLTARADDLVAAEWDLDAGPLALDVPLGPLFVNGYAPVDINPSAVGLSRDDIELSVAEGVDAGAVSAGIEATRPDGTFVTMLLAGFLPGEYHLVATRVSDGAEQGRARFRVTTLWPDDAVGPAVHLTGAHQTYRLMSWGGTGAADYFNDPAPEVWRVAVVLIETKDRSWGPLEASAKTAWKDRAIGSGDSLKTFYEEVSYRNTSAPPGSPLKGMTINLLGARVLGPVKVDAGWGDLFEGRKGTDLERGWTTKATAKATIAGAISTWMADQPDGHSIMAAADSIVVVVRSATDKPTPMSGSTPAIPTRFCWGHASRTDFWRKDTTTSTYTQGPKPVTFLTSEYPAGLANPPILANTLCHEIGHNLGLADLYDAKGDYPAEINARVATNADLMTTSKPLPHFSIANRIRLGWLDRSWVRRFDFSASPTGGVVTLHATEALARTGPPAGRSAGIEVPIADGWSYFFELRREVAGQVGDQSLERLTPSARLVLGTDVRQSGGMAARPPILMLPIDADGDGPVLDTDADDFQDSDTTNPARMHDFTLEVTALSSPDTDIAQVDVTYLAAHRPQLQVRAAPGRGNWKSPDIELSNPMGVVALGAIKGIQNAIKITVHNLGTLPAEDVQVHVKWLPYTTSAGEWIALGDPAPFNVPAVGLTSFVVPWQIPSSVKVGDVEAEHFCVRVEIERYRDPAHPEHEEIVVFDNWAQSNFDASPVSFGSPSARIRTVTTTANSLGRNATYLLGVDQSSDWYRVYLGHAWLRLGAGEERAVELAYESLAGDPERGALFEQYLERITNEVNHVAVSSWLVPENTECETPREWWGVSLDLRAGRSCWFEDVRLNGEVVTAVVLTSVDGRVEQVSFGDVHLAAWFDDRPEEVFTSSGSIDDGHAFVVVGGELLQGVAEGRALSGVLARDHGGGYAASVSDVLAL